MDRRSPSRAVRSAGVAVAAIFIGATGCSSSGSSAAPPPSFTPTTPSLPTCPAPKPTTPQWPSSVPKDLPRPPNAKIIGKPTVTNDVHILRFETQTSLRDSVLFVVDKLPKAGYVLGRGDAEATEADAPFVHGTVRGLMRLLELGQCQTEWLLATVDVSATTGTSPLLPPHTPSGSPSPLPFG